MNVRLLTLLAASAFALSAPLTAHAYDSRAWADASGNFTFNGTIDPERSFVEGSDSVVLVDAKGRAVKCPVEQLCAIDKEYVDVVRQAFTNKDAELEEKLGWTLDPSRDAAIRRVVTIDGIDYAFRWIPPGRYSVPTEEYDPNLTKTAATNKAEAKAKKAAPRKFVKNGFWTLETEVTLEMFNQFVTETKYKPSQPLNRAGAVGASKTSKVASNDPYAEIDAESKAPAKPQNASNEKSRLVGYSAEVQKFAGLKRGDEFNWKNPGFPQTKKNPVALVTKKDALAFCDWLSSKTGKNVSLPTTDQWLLASQPAQGSIDYVTLFAQWSFGSDDAWERGNLPDANYAVICPSHVYLLDRIPFVYRDSYRFTVPVGTFKPNGNGLYDMIGNVGEMVADDDNIVESLGGSWFHLPGFNPICWVYADSFGLAPVDRAIRDYEASRVAPSFTEQVAQDPYMDDFTMPMGTSPQASGNPFAGDDSYKPFMHIEILDVDATCFTGFRVIVQ